MEKFWDKVLNQMQIAFQSIRERPNISGSGSGSAELAGSVGSVVWPKLLVRWVRPNQQVRSAEPKPNQFYPIYAVFIRF